MKLKLFLLFVCGALAVQAGDSPVVIQVGSSKVTLEDLQKLKDSASAEQVRAATMDAVFRPLRDQKAVELILETAKSKENLSSDPEVLKMMKEAQKAIEMQVFLGREVQKRITDDKLKVIYAEVLKKVKNQKEMEVSIILTGNEGEANIVLAELNTGKDFSEVAQKHSIEPNTKKQGGRVGFLIEGAISEVLGPDVAQSLKVLKDGVHSKKVIKTKDGKFLIVRRGSSRAAVVPQFEELKPQLVSMYSQKGLIEYIDEIKKTLGAKVFTMDGKPDTLQIVPKKQ